MIVGDFIPHDKLEWSTLQLVVVVVILFPTEYKQCITAYMKNNIKNKTT